MKWHTGNSVCHYYAILRQKMQFCRTVHIQISGTIRDFCSKFQDVSSDKQICCISDITQYTDSSFCTIHRLPGICKNKQQDSAYQQNCTVNNRFRQDMKRWDRSWHTQDKKNIENIRSDCISKSQTAVSFSCSYDWSHKLWQGGTDRNNGETDKVLAYTKWYCNLACIVYYKITTEDNGKIGRASCRERV